MTKTGPDTDTRLKVVLRASYRCERCLQDLTTGASVHHRNPRRMGGTRKSTTNSPANLLLLCGTGTTGCHGWIETNRTIGYATGIILYDKDNPTEHPYMDTQGQWWQLHEDGTKTRHINPSNMTPHDNPEGKPHQ